MAARSVPAEGRANLRADGSRELWAVSGSSSGGPLAAEGQPDRPDAVSPSPGLVNNTYLDRGDDNRIVGRLEVWEGGTLASLRIAHRTGLRGKFGGGIRGRVGVFNRGMRVRLLRGVAKILQAAGRPLFVSTTYPEHFPTAEESKSHLFRWMRVMKRLYPDFCCVWRLGFQGRGAPHFHLVVWGVPWLSIPVASAVWLSTAAGDLLAQMDESERAGWLKRGVDVTRAKSARSAGGYCAKYAAKVEAEPGPMWCGRRWGWYNAGKLPVAPRKVYEVWNFYTFYNVRRHMRRLARRRRLTGRSGITIFCGYPQDLARLL